MFKKISFSTLFLCLLSMFLISVPGHALASSKWPEKNLTMYIGFSAGGTADIVARSMAKYMSDYLKQDINCINVTGANAAVAARQVMDAPADGYSVFSAVAHSSGGWRILGYADLGWEDFYGFHSVTSPYVLFVNARKETYKNTEELISAIKKNPSKIKWGTAGLGSINHLTGEMMLNILGCKATAVPYKGGREAAIKVIAGEVDFSWAGASDVMDLAETGQIKIIGVAQDNPMTVKMKSGKSYDAPAFTATWKELKAVENLLFWGLQINRKTPPEIVKKFEEAVNYTLNNAEFKKLIGNRFLNIVPSKREQDDELRAKLEGIYAWGLYDLKMAKEGLTPGQLNISEPAKFVWPNEISKKINPWP